MLSFALNQFAGKRKNASANNQPRPLNAGNGAIYAMMPLIKRRLTGQIAGMVGAFGNVGGVLFLAVYSIVDVRTFFLIAAASAVLGLLLTYLCIEEPKGQIAEEMPDGSIAMIDVT